MHVPGRETSNRKGMEAGACKGTQREEQQGAKEKLAEGPGWKLLE